MDTVLIMIKFFLSIKTTLWLTGISILAFVTGSFFIPKNLDVFSEINDTPLFKWLSINTSEIGKTFWIYAIICLMAILCLNTIVCSIDAVLRRLSWKGLINTLSPQILHIGVLFVLFGHFISAMTGYKQDIPMKKNMTTNFKEFNISLTGMNFSKSYDEDTTRWRVHLDIDNNQFIIEPARPAFYRNVYFFVKSADEKSMRAIIGLVYDPGVVWEILGAAVFILGAAGIFYRQITSSTK